MLCKSVNIQIDDFLVSCNIEKNLKGIKITYISVNFLIKLGTYFSNYHFVCNIKTVFHSYILPI